MKVGDILICKKDYISEYSNSVILSYNTKYKIESISIDFEYGVEVAWINSIAYSFQPEHGFIHSIQDLFYTEDEFRLLKLDSI